MCLKLLSQLGNGFMFGYDLPTIKTVTFYVYA